MKKFANIVIFYIVFTTSQHSFISSAAFFHRENPPESIVPFHLRIFSKAKTVSSQQNSEGRLRWSRLMFSFRKDRNDTPKTSSNNEKNARSTIHKFNAAIQEGLDELKNAIQDTVDTKVRPWTIDTTVKRPNSSVSWTRSLVIANVALYALQMFSPSVTRFGTKRSDLILRGKELHRLITPVFLHGSVTHLLMNTFSLHNIGPEVEKLFGPGRFIATYLVAGVTGNILSALNTPNPSLGASGAIFGLMGAYYTFLNRNGHFFGRSASIQMDNVGRTLFMNVIFGLSSPSIDNWGHIGGALGGAAMAYYFGPKLFIAQLPNGARLIVDKPVLRLPRMIESIPENVSKTFDRMKRRMQVETHLTNHKSKRWRLRKQPDRKRLWYERINGSIKPLFGVD